LRLGDEESLARRDGSGQAVDEFGLAHALNQLVGHSQSTTRIAAPDGYGW